MITAALYPLDIRQSGQKDLERNMQTNRKTTANEATRMSGRISEIRDVNVIKPVPRRHRLLCLLDVISGLLGAAQSLSVPPATRRTWVRESDPRRERRPMRRERRRKEERQQVFPASASAVGEYRRAASNQSRGAAPTGGRGAGEGAGQSRQPMGGLG